MVKIAQPRLRGLYAITWQQSQGATLLNQVEQALQGGAQLVQYRNKSDGDFRSLTTKFTEATALLHLCHNYQVPLIINDNIELAYAIGADGIHLGQNDASPLLARQKLGPQAIIGVSCYNDLHLALEAQVAGANYLAFGSFFPSPTKPQAKIADLAVLQQAKALFNLPIVAIGGITAANGGVLIKAGADMLAVVSGIFAAQDVKMAAVAITNLFANF